jgi:hypothetical protein
MITSGFEKQDFYIKMNTIYDKLNKVEEIADE